MSSPIEITAVYLRERIRFENPDGDTVIGDIKLVNGSQEPETDDQFNQPSLAVKGKPDGTELLTQQTYRFYGRWSKYTNKRTGQDEKQFAFDTVVQAQPHDRAGIIAYLRQAGESRGIGTARARKLWDKFGGDAVRVLRETPAAAAAAVRGLKESDAIAASEWLQDKQALEDATIAVTSLLAGRGFPKSTASLAIKEFGNLAFDAIKRDPYCLMQFRGCGFKRCDALWLDLGLPADRLRRQAFCAWYAVASDTEGHTWYPLQFAVHGLTQQIGGSRVRPAAAIKMAKRIGKLSPDRHGALAVARHGLAGEIVDAGGKVMLAEGRKAWCEDRLAECLVDAMEESYQ